MDENAEYCEDCSKMKHVYTEGRSLYEYRAVDASIYRFKYGGRCEYADYYAKAFAYYLGDVINGWNPDAIISVPLHKKKMRKRGYNQSALIAKGISKELGIPYLEDVIIRSRNTVAMKELDARTRQINLKNAFKICHFDVKLKHIVIVDDIYTTGSTIDSMASVLLEHGVQKVFFVTLATGAAI